MRWGCWRHPHIAQACLSAATMLALGTAGCGAAPSTAGRTPIAQVTPSPTATLTPSPTTTPTPEPTATPTPEPTPTPAPTATPAPSPTPPAVCVPDPTVRAVSSAVVRYGKTSERQVSLTFDSDGGKSGNATQYLGILSAHQIHVTWFLTGDFARANPSLVRRIRDDGHDIGNHTDDHANLIKPPRTDSFICSELTEADREISQISGLTTRPFFRPPYGDYNDQVRTLAARLGYRTVYWSIDPRDWDSATTAQDIVSRVLNSPNLKPGAIILMHVNSAHEAEALDAVIAGLEQRGYAIVPLSQLLS